MPEQTRIYAIGDVHGRADLLESLFTKIDADMQARPLARMYEVLLGDYIDRGPDSKRVIDLLVERLLKRGGHTICLKGNHEQFLLDLLDTGEGMENWLGFGGLEALVSYGVAPGKSGQRDFAELTKQLKLAIPRTHMIF